MTTNFSALVVPPTGGSPGRTIPDILADVVNVKDYGAKGDGVTDDRAAIQSAIDAAFGPPGAPNGSGSTTFFHSRPLIFPNGYYIVKGPLILTQVHGIRICGAGKLATIIENTNTSGGNLYSGSVFVTNGMQYAIIEDLTVKAAPPVSGSFTATINNGSMTSSALTGAIQPGQSLSGTSCHFSISGITSNVMTVTGTPTGTPGVLVVGAYIVELGRLILSFGTGTGGAGTYNLSSGPDVGATSLTTGVVPGAVVLSGGGTSWAVIPQHSVAAGTAVSASTANRGFDLAWNAAWLTGAKIDNGSGGAGTSLTFTGGTGFTAVGQVLNGVAILANTMVLGQTSTGWLVDQSQLVASEQMVSASPGFGYDASAATGTNTVSLHAITFANVRFENGDHGCGIGDGGQMGSEVLFVGCDFVNCAIGVIGFNFNALDYTFLGGSFQNCGKGIETNGTSTFSYMFGCSFSGSMTCDISFNSYDGMVVEACTSTSASFTSMLGSVPLHTKACLFTPSATGSFAFQAQAQLIIDGCLGTNCKLSTAANSNGGVNHLYMRGNNLPATFLTGVVNPPIIAENI